MLGDFFSFFQTRFKSRAINGLPPERFIIYLSSDTIRGNHEQRKIITRHFGKTVGRGEITWKRGISSNFRPSFFHK